MIETFDGDFVVDDPVLFFKEILDLSKPSEHITNRELPTIKAADNVDYCTPQVYWYQTETAVRISVKIADARDCYIHLSKNRILSFRAKRNDQLYSFKLMLYEPVESLQQILSETDIRVTLIKSKLFEWPRLILSKQRSKNIHYDLTKLKYEEKHKLFLEIPKEVDDGLESDDDVIDMMYNVCSDLESDYDQDLENDSD